MDTKTRLLRYLKGELSSADQHAMEEVLAQDPALQDALETLAASQATEEIEKNLSAVQSRWQDQNAPSALTSGLLWVAAIVFLAFTLWSAWRYYHNQQETRLYADFFTAIPADDTTLRGASDAGTPEEEEALYTYLEGDYEQSFALFSNLATQQPYDGHTALYLGLSAMQLGRFHTAQLQFEKIIALDMDYADLPAAHWYLALSQLQLDDLPAVKSSLKWLIANDPGEQGQKARVLLEKLN